MMQIEWYQKLHKVVNAFWEHFNLNKLPITGREKKSTDETKLSNNLHGWKEKPRSTSNSSSFWMWTRWNNSRRRRWSITNCEHLNCAQLTHELMKRMKKTDMMNSEDHDGKTEKDKIMGLKIPPLLRPHLSIQNENLLNWDRGLMLNDNKFVNNDYKNLINDNSEIIKPETRKNS